MTGKDVRAVERGVSCNKERESDGHQQHTLVHTLQSLPSSSLEPPGDQILCCHEPSILASMACHGFQLFIGCGWCGPSRGKSRIHDFWTCSASSGQPICRLRVFSSVWEVEASALALLRGIKSTGELAMARQAWFALGAVPLANMFG